MNVSLRGGLRWLYPGMRIKRWGLLVLCSAGLLIFVLLVAVGKEQIRLIYQLLPSDGAARDSILILASLAGLAGFALGVARLVRSIARGVAPGSQEKATDLIFRTRVLERGPRVVALGGGTGLSTLLRGLKEATSNITAVVTVTDDGGSSGRLRAELDVLPPGDVRNCILALAEDEERMARLFQHRFRGPAELDGHSVGNLLLVGMEQATGGFDRAIEEMSHILNVRGRVLPATLTRTQLAAQMDDGEWVEGETRVARDPRRIRRVRLSVKDVPAHPAVLEAIARAELVLLGPGSLFTSLVPNLLVDGISAAVRAAPCEKMYVANLMTEHGETDGFSLCDHLRVLDEYIPLRSFLINITPPADHFLQSYREERAEPVTDDLEAGNKYGLQGIREDLLGTLELEGKLTVKHDPYKLTRVIVRHSRAFSRRMITPSPRQAGEAAPPAG
jgi:uncharacterized cofD-like protein